MLLAAAVLAGLLLVTRREPVPPGVVLVPPVRSDPTPYVVEAPAGRSVAVIATDDPDITVLWFFEGGSP